MDCTKKIIQSLSFFFLYTCFYTVESNVCSAIFSFYLHRNLEEKRATWKLSDISELSENGCQGCIRAKFDTSNGPNNPSPTAIQFIAEGATLSGLDFELVGFGYRLSLVKKRFGTGEYDNSLHVVGNC